MMLRRPMFHCGLYWRYFIPFGVSLICVCATVMASPSVEEIIEKARAFDTHYVPDEEASQQQAIALYRDALKLNPDKNQRLHVLRRIALLYGMETMKHKGEMPDYSKAVEYHKMVVNEYPPDRPEIFRSMIAISSHSTTLRRFPEAIRWSERVLDFDVSVLEQQAKRLRSTNADAEELNRLNKLIKAVYLSHTLAVRRITRVAKFIDKRLYTSKLNGLIAKYPGTHIADLAKQRLNSDEGRRMAKFWDLPSDFDQLTADKVTDTPDIPQKTITPSANISNETSKPILSPTSSIDNYNSNFLWKLLIWGIFIVLLGSIIWYIARVVGSRFWGK